MAQVFRGGAELPDVAPDLAALVVVATLRGLLTWAEEVLAQRAGGRLTSRLRRELAQHLFVLGPAFTARERSGELASLAVQGLEAVETLIVVFQPARLLASSVPFLVAAVVLVLDPPTVLVLLFTGPILVLLLGFIGSRAGSITERRFAELRWMSALFLDLLQGLATLKMFGRSAEQAETIRIVSQRLGDTTMEVLRTAFQTALVLEWGAAVAMAVVAVEVSLRLMAGGMTFERALAVLVVTPEFFLPLRNLAIRYHAGAAGRTAGEHILAVLDEAPSAGTAWAGAIQARATPAVPVVAVPSASTPAPMPALTPARPAARAPAPHLRLVDVTFAYEGRDRALDGLSLEVLPGRMTVVAGATGAGKSTVVALLLRFVEPDSGAILVDGQPLEQIDPVAWRTAIGWVPQRPHLFHGSIADNLRLAHPTATDADLRHAAEAAGADSFIRALPGGYAAPIGEDGLRLSGGQRQRLAIARALLRDAPLLVLDEPTSHLDERSERAVLDVLRRATSRATVLVVSHRMRVVEAADQVVVVEGGREVEAGRPAELAVRDGYFRRLAAANRVSPAGVE